MDNDETRLDLDAIADVAALVAAAQGVMPLDEFPTEALLELEEIGALGEDVSENINNVIDHCNKAVGTAYILSILASLIGAQILKVDKSKFDEFFELEEGSYLQ